MTKHEELCRELVELNGGHWHELDIDDDDDLFCSCGSGFLNDKQAHEHIKNFNSTFQHPDEVLEVMDKRKDSHLFYAVLIYGNKPNVEAIDDTGYIDRDYITKKDKLLTEAVEWCQEHKEGV